MKIELKLILELIETKNSWGKNELKDKIKDLAIGLIEDKDLTQPLQSNCKGDGDENNI